MKSNKTTNKCRADALHDAIMASINAAVENGASLTEVSGALHVAIVRVQGRIYLAFRDEDEVKP